MTSDTLILVSGAASIGLIHTLLGPDHYLPFVALAKAEKWSLAKTIRITAACGAGHLAASLGVVLIGILLGWGLGAAGLLEQLRGDLVGWLLIGFGLAYAAWGFRRAARSREHSHWHAHGDGTVHSHHHHHEGAHLHVHAPEPATGFPRAALTPWVLFVVFLFGPCEPLIPLLMVPAAAGQWWQLGLAAAAFSVTTIAAMTGAVAAGFLGLSRWSPGRLRRHTHSLAGLTVAACGAAICLGF